MSACLTTMRAYTVGFSLAAVFAQSGDNVGLFTVDCEAAWLITLHVQEDWTAKLTRKGELFQKRCHTAEAAAEAVDRFLASKGLDPMNFIAGKTAEPQPQHQQHTSQVSLLFQSAACRT